MKLSYLYIIILFIFSCQENINNIKEKVYFDSTFMLIKHEKYCDNIPCINWIYYYPDSSRFLELVFSKKVKIDSPYISEKKIYEKNVMIKHSFYDEKGNSYKTIIPDKVLYYSSVYEFDEVIVSDTTLFESFISNCIKCHRTSKYTGDIYNTFYSQKNIEVEDLLNSNNFISHHDSLELAQEEIYKILSLIKKITIIHPKQYIPSP